MKILKEAKLGGYKKFNLDLDKFGICVIIKVEEEGKGNGKPIP